MGRSGTRRCRVVPDHPEEVVADIAESTWRLLGGCSAELRSLQDCERGWVDADRAAVVRAEHDATALTKRFLEVEEEAAQVRAVVAVFANEADWKPTGPCGQGCDWPSCTASGMVSAFPGP